MQYLRKEKVQKHFIYIYNNPAQNNSQDSRVSISVQFKNILDIF